MNANRPLAGLLGSSDPLVTQITGVGFFPLFEVTSATATPPTLIVESTSGISGANFVMRWDSESGTNYQVQCSTDLASWLNIGEPISGTGASMSWSSATDDVSEMFYRVIASILPRVTI